jgi:bifunctional non-homologous end joining protein LigD
MSLVLLPAAFHHPAFLWEIKHDGFRSLACVRARACRLFSRAGHAFRQFDVVADAIARAVGKWRSAVLDGEIVVLGRDGRSRFGLCRWDRTRDRVNDQARH